MPNRETSWKWQESPKAQLPTDLLVTWIWGKHQLDYEKRARYASTKRSISKRKVRHLPRLTIVMYFYLSVDRFPIGYWVGLHGKLSSNHSSALFIQLILQLGIYDDPGPWAWNFSYRPRRRPPHPNNIHQASIISNPNKYSSTWSSPNGVHKEVSKTRF